MPRTPQSGVEEWLARWAGEEIVPREPQSRVEQQLARLAGVNIVPEPPQSPEEDWLEIIYQNGGGGGITPTGTISITENGEYDVTQYAGANVDVWQGFDYRGLSGLKFVNLKDSVIDVSDLDTSGFSNMSSMFSNCSNLTYLDLSNFDTSNVTTITGLCTKCTLLESVNMQSFVTAPNLINAATVISDSTALTDIIWAIDSTTVQPLPTAKGFDKVTNTVPSDLNIWVRDSLLTSYQGATNWSRYSACFKPISQLPAALQALYNIDPSDYL